MVSVTSLEKKSLGHSYVVVGQHSLRGPTVRGHPSEPIGQSGLDKVEKQTSLEEVLLLS